MKPLIDRSRIAWIASGVSGLLVAAAFPDLAFDLLVWVALVPLFAAARGAGWRRGLLLGMVGGVALQIAGFYWIGYAAYAFSHLNIVVVAFLFALSALFHAIPWGVLGLLLGRCRAPRDAYLVAAIWVGVEYLFPHLFPWHLGDALFARPWMRQGADLFGGSGLTHVALAVNIAIYLILEWRRARIPFPRIDCAVAVLLLAFLAVYGAVRSRGLESEAEPIRAAIIQPNVDPSKKMEPEAYRAIVAKSIRLARADSPDVLLWPEGADPIPFHEVKRPDLFQLVGVPLVIGGSTRVGERWAVSAAYIRAEGMSLYHKNRLVLFGERLPFNSIIPEFIRAWIPVTQLHAGSEAPSMRLGERTFRVLICYEAILSDYVRRVVNSAEELDFLVNLTEDGWYGRSSQAGQHRAVLVMRVVEARVPLVRCTNVGPSGGVTIAGDFVDATPTFTSAEGVVSIRPGREWSLFRAGGHLYPYAALVVGVVASIASHRRRRYTPT